MIDRLDRHALARSRTAWIAAALAATALLTWTSGRRAEKRHPPTGRFVDVDGHRLHYLEAGTGSPVSAWTTRPSSDTLSELSCDGVVSCEKPIEEQRSAPSEAASIRVISPPEPT